MKKYKILFCVKKGFVTDYINKEFNHNEEGLNCMLDWINDMKQEYKTYSFVVDIIMTKKNKEFYA